jgi:hypothetical protein
MSVANAGARRPFRAALATAFVLAFTVTSTVSPAGAQPAPQCSQPRATGFEDMTVEQRFGPGGTFASGGAAFEVLGGDGYARVDDAGAAGGTGLELEVNNVLLDVSFGGPVGALTVRYGDHGGTVQLEIDGISRTVGGFEELDGATFGDVGVSVVEDVDLPVGTVSLDGRIESFAIGGQELWIDDVSGVSICPNLSIASPTHRFDEDGGRLVLTAEVGNEGDAMAPSNIISVSAEGWGTTTATVPSVEPDERAEVTIPIDVPGSERGRTVAFVVRVDAEGTVSETDEGDNQASVEAVVPVADLTITLGAIEARDDVVVIPVLATNQGDARSRTTTVVSAAEGWPAGTAAVPRLMPGDEVELALEVDLPDDRRGRTATFVVTIDPDDVVRREHDEANNSAEGSVDVPVQAIPTSGSLPWIPILVLLIAAAAVGTLWLRRRVTRPRRVDPRLSRLGLDLRPGQPSVGLTERSDGSPKHTVAITLRVDRSTERVREGTLR